MAIAGSYRKDHSFAIMSGLMAAMLIALLAWWVLFWLVAPASTPYRALSPEMWWSATKSYLSDFLPFGKDALAGVLNVRGWRETASILHRASLLDPFLGRVHAVFLAAGLALAFTIYGMAKKSPTYRVDWRYVRGRQLREGGDAVYYANKEFRKDIDNQNKPGLFIVPGVQMDLARETETFLTVGGPGSGKTVWYRYMISQILERGARSAAAIAAGVLPEQLDVYPDKLIALCVKGDQTERWPVEHDFMLMAPHDAGTRKTKTGVKQIGVAWDIAKDIIGLPAAKDLAVRIIPESTDPVWADAAREIFTGFVVGMQISKPGAWTWSDLRSLMEKPAAYQKKFLEAYYPSGAGFYILTKSGPNRTTASYLANITAKVYPLVLGLALGWESYSPEHRISLREWILDPNPAKRTLILQMSGQVRTISAAWVRAVVNFMASFVASPELPEDSKRRIWWLLDEFPQVAQKDDGFLQVVEVGRSKGFCAIIAAQVLAQFEKTWSKAELETLEAMARSVLLFRTGAGSAADYLSDKLVGWVEYRARNKSQTVGRDPSRNISTSTERELTVQPNYFHGHLGKFRRGVVFPRGVFALFVGGDNACRLEIPFPKWKPQRAGTVLADWIRDPRTMLREVNEDDILAVMASGGGLEEEEAPASSKASGPLQAGRSALERLNATNPELLRSILPPSASAASTGPEAEEDEDE